MPKKRNILIAFILISLLIIYVVHFTFSTSIQNKKDQIESEMKKSLTIQQYLYLEDNTEVLSELLLTKDLTQEIIKFAQPHDSQLQKQDLDVSLHTEMNQIFTMIIKRINLIDQVSFISVTGKEISTVYLNDYGEVKAIAPNKLSNKATQDYFLKSKQLDDYSIYISSLDLNMSAEMTDSTKTINEPIIRIATPIYKNGAVEGVIVLNFLVQKLFSNNIDLTKSSQFSSEIIDNNLYYFHAENPDNNLSYLYGKKILFTDFHNFNPIELGLEDKTTFTLQNNNIYGIHILSSKKIRENLQTKAYNNYKIESDFGNIIFIEKYEMTEELDAKTIRFKQLLLTITLILLFYEILFYLYKLTEKKEQEREELSYHVRHDSLTGLLNKKAMVEKLESLKSKKIPLTLLFLDIDNFKEINDYHGHEAGDLVLKEVSNRLLNTIPEKSKVSRIGGDEFLIYLFETDKKEIEYIAEKLISYTNQPIYYKGASIKVGISIGITTDNKYTIGDMINMADDAMYTTKKTSKNNYTFFDKNIIISKQTEKDLKPIDT